MLKSPDTSQNINFYLVLTRTMKKVKVMFKSISIYESIQNFGRLLFLI